MAPLPDNNTPTLFLDYTSGGQNHTAEVRLPSAATTSTASAAAATIAAVMKNTMLTSDTIKGARFRAQGSTFSFPVSVTATAGTIAGTADPDLKPAFYSFTGRSSDGRRVRFTVFTNYVNTMTDGYRDATPAAAFASVLAALGSSGADARTISGLAPTWNPYVNFGNNAYYQRKTRKTDSK